MPKNNIQLSPEGEVNSGGYNTETQSIEVYIYSVLPRYLRFNPLENCCHLALVLEIKPNGRSCWHLELGISKAKSLNKVDVTLSGVSISVFSPKLLIIKYEYVQIYDDSFRWTAAILKNTTDCLCAWSTKGILALTHAHSQPKLRVTKTKSLSKQLVLFFFQFKVSSQV